MVIIRASKEEGATVPNKCEERRGERA